MSRRLASTLGLLLALSAVGCAASTAASSAPSPEGVTDKGGRAQPDGTAATDGGEPGAIPEGSRFFCHLNCSGRESTTYGPTEEDARASARALVKERCRPEDGQYFLVCEALE